MKYFILIRTVTEKFQIEAKSLKEAKWKAAGNADILDPFEITVVKEKIAKQIFNKKKQ